MIIEIRDAVIAGIIWALTYLFVRKYLNPSTRAFYMEFAEDAFYGGLAVSVNMLLLIGIYKYILNHATITRS